MDMNKSFMKIIAQTECSKSLKEHTKQQHIPNPWPKVVRIIIEDYYDCYKEEIKTDRTITRERYARFVCALSWGQLDLSNTQNRNNAFNALKYIGDSWIFQTRMQYHSMKAYEQHNHFFTKKQQAILRKLLQIDIAQHGDAYEDDVDTDDEEARDAPGRCPSCGDEPPGDKDDGEGYECERCAQQTYGAFLATLSD